jgi:competence protein ComFA
MGWSGTLSESQQYASFQVTEAMEQNRELLVWAVCGAGKTEILFEGIGVALKQGKNVCLTAPRTDVIHELTPRLKAVFPCTAIASLYGGSEERQQKAQLVIATTHQLFRFKDCFDVIIIDEVDAFPYSYDKSLSFAVKKARKQESSLIYVTATPEFDLKKRVKRGELPSVRIPARFHRHPLPVPIFTWCGNWQKKLHKERLPTELTGWLEKIRQSQQQVFLFAPEVAILEKVVALLSKQDVQITGVHANDPDRKEKVTAFRNGEIPILVTTTILERGVTVPNVAVAVLGSESPIFTENALVQIAGRAGRSSLHPTGEVAFFHYGKTEAMLQAVSHIKEMNSLAKQQGLLRESI